MYQFLLLYLLLPPNPQRTVVSSYSDGVWVPKTLDDLFEFFPVLCLVFPQGQNAAKGRFICFSCYQKRNTRLHNAIANFSFAIFIDCSDCYMLRYNAPIDADSLLHITKVVCACMQGLSMHQLVHCILAASRVLDQWLLASEGNINLHQF